MNKIVVSFILFCLMVTVAYSKAPAQDQEQKPITYELKIAQFADTYGKTPQYVYTIGDVAYRSVDDLKKFIDILQKGSIIEWRPSCEGPRALSEAEENKIKAFCNAKGVKFIHVPSG